MFYWRFDIESLLGRIQLHYKIYLENIYVCVTEKQFLL